MDAEACKPSLFVRSYSNSISFASGKLLPAAVAAAVAKCGPAAGGELMRLKAAPGCSATSRGQCVEQSTSTTTSCPRSLTDLIRVPIIASPTTLIGIRDMRPNRMTCRHEPRRSSKSESVFQTRREVGRVIRSRYYYACIVQGIVSFCNL